MRSASASMRQHPQSPLNPPAAQWTQIASCAHRADLVTDRDGVSDLHWTDPGFKCA